jgi:C2H2-type zinc finger protein
MNRSFLVLGIILLALGIAGYYITSQTSLIGGRTHNLYPLGAIGLAVLGALIAAGGVVMGKPGAKTGGQFKCATCGAVFGSQTALDQHKKDKHGK